MNKIWGYVSAFFIGAFLAALAVFKMLAQYINNDEITIKRQVQKNRKSNENVQEHNSSINNAGKRKRLKTILKKKKNGNN